MPARTPTDLPPGATTDVSSVPAALWLALASALLTGGLLALWTSGNGGMRALRSGARAVEWRVRDVSPSLAAQSYYDALRLDRPDRALAVASGRARQPPSGETARVLESAPRTGLSSLNLEETRKVDDRTLRLFGSLAVTTEGAMHEVRAEFDVVSEAGAFRVARMALSWGEQP